PGQAGDAAEEEGPVGAGGTGSGAPGSAQDSSRADAARPQASARQTVRVEVERLDDLMNLVGELVIGRGQLEQQVRSIGDRALADVVGGLSRTISDLQEAVGRARMVTLDG